MDFFEVIKKRRSIRRYTNEKVPEDVLRKALSAAVLAPNSSNLQTWNFYWVRSEDKKQKLVQACLNQSAARTAQELVVVVADRQLWKRSNPYMIKYTKSIQAPKPVQDYYEKLMPISQRSGPLSILAPVKWLLMNITGLFRPMVRGPVTAGDNSIVSIKSAALACENFVLAIAAQGYATCMMEGFDECRVKKLLQLSWSARVVMVISVGKEASDGTWGPQFRIPESEVIHEV